MEEILISSNLIIRSYLNSMWVRNVGRSQWLSFQEMSPTVFLSIMVL